VATGISSQAVTRALEKAIEQRVRPKSLRQRARVHQPGRPMQNGHVESFNGKFRDECLNANCFTNLEDARRGIERWRVE